jgi:hypothetical protein
LLSGNAYANILSVNDQKDLIKNGIIKKYPEEVIKLK